jgi:serine/threonine protein kinase
VYDAFDRERHARVALKTLRTTSAETLLILKKEFRAVQDIRHPNLVHVGEVFEASGTWFFTMEFIEGVDFVQYVSISDRRARPPRQRLSSIPPAGASSHAPHHFDEERIRATLPQLVRGLKALHEASKIHRDVKPSNVLVTHAGRVVILDFGVVGDVVPGANAEQGVRNPERITATVAPPLLG